MMRSQKAVECGRPQPAVSRHGSCLRGSRPKLGTQAGGRTSHPPVPNRVQISSPAGSGRGASHHKVHVHLCDHTFFNICNPPDPAAAVRGPRSVLRWVLFGQTVADPRIHRSAVPPRPKSFSKPSSFLGRDYLCTSRISNAFVRIPHLPYFGLQVSPGHFIVSRYRNVFQCDRS